MVKKSSSFVRFENNQSKIIRFEYCFVWKVLELLKFNNENDKKKAHVFKNKARLDGKKTGT